MLTAPPGASWSVDPTIPILSKDARATEYKRAEEIVKQAFARQPSYNVLVPTLLKLGVDKLETACGVQVGIPIKPMLGSITKDMNDMAKVLEGRAFACEYKFLPNQKMTKSDTTGSEHKFTFPPRAESPYSLDIWNS